MSCVPLSTTTHGISSLLELVPLRTLMITETGFTTAQKLMMDAVRPPQPHTAATTGNLLLALRKSLHWDCSTSPLLDAASCLARQPHCTSLLPICGTRPRRLHRFYFLSGLIPRHTPQSIPSLTSKLTRIFFGALVSTPTQSDSPSPRICPFSPHYPALQGIRFPCSPITNP
jgi:hypothetical protein